MLDAKLEPAEAENELFSKSNVARRTFNGRPEERSQSSLPILPIPAVATNGASVQCEGSILRAIF
jgi:hypothetical protein